MNTLTIVIPSIREHLLKRCLSSLGDCKYPIHILAQKFHPEVDHVYEDEFLPVMKAFDKAIKTAPPSKYLLLADDDFIFRDGYESAIELAIHTLNHSKTVGCIVLVDSEKSKSQNGRVNTELSRNIMHRVSDKDIIHLRKESGILIRSDVLKENIKFTPKGEDFSRIMHCYFDGYDVGMIKANITHAHDKDDPMGWSKLSKEKYGEGIDYDHKSFYYSVLRELGLLDENGISLLGLRIHSINFIRLCSESLAQKEN